MTKNYDVYMTRLCRIRVCLEVSVNAASEDERLAAAKKQALEAANTIYWNFGEEPLEGYLNPNTASPTSQK